MVAIGETLVLVGPRWDATRERALEPGLHPLVLSRRDWACLLASYQHDGWRMILLTPDPPPGDQHGPAPSGIDRFWFRGAPKRGSVPARVADLARRINRLAASGTITGIEGIEVLLFWNSTSEVVELLELLGDRLSEVGSPGLLLVRPRLLSESEAAAIAPGPAVKEVHGPAPGPI